MKPEDSGVCYVDVCDLTVAIVLPYKFSKYVAQIKGSDTVFGYARQFLRFEERYDWGAYVVYAYGELSDGVYEISVKYYNPDDKADTIYRRRSLLIVCNEESLVVPYDSINKDSVLFIVDAIKCGQYKLQKNIHLRV